MQPPILTDRQYAILCYFMALARTTWDPALRDALVQSFSSAARDEALVPRSIPMLQKLYQLTIGRLRRESSCASSPQTDDRRVESLVDLPWRLMDQIGQRAHDAMTTLTPEELGPLVRLAIEMGRRKSNADAQIHAVMLNQISVLRQHALQGFEFEILASDLPCHETVFRRADADVLKELVRRVRKREYPAFNPYMAIAWIGSDTAVKALTSFGRESFMEEVGWAVEHGTPRRQLYADVAYELVPADAQQGPVSVLDDLSDKCPQCGTPLMVLFRLDLADPRLSFIEWGSARDAGARCGPHQSSPAASARPIITVPMCPQCVQHTTQWFALDVSGQPMPGEPQTALSSEAAGDASLPRHCLQLGPQRPTPFVAEKYCYAGRISQIGGHPHWIQGAEYPNCSQCNRAMNVVGQVDGAEIGRADCVYYGFLCSACHQSAVSMQRS